MRIFEIDGTNEIWAQFNGVPLKLDGRHATAINIAKLALRNNNPAVNSGYRPIFDAYEDVLENRIINGSWPDSTDQDVIDLITDAKQKLAEFRALRAQIK